MSNIKSKMSKAKSQKPKDKSQKTNYKRQNTNIKCQCQPTSGQIRRSCENLEDLVRSQLP